MDKDVQCAMGLLASKSVEDGYPQNPDDWFGALTDPHSKGRMGNAESRRFRRLVEMATPTEAINFLNRNGFPAYDLYSWTVAPEAILGKDVVAQIEKLYADHIAEFGHVGNFDAWKKNRGQIEDIIDKALDNLPPQAHHYATQYAEMHIAGGQLFGNLVKKTPIGKIVDNLTGSVVTLNPGIALGNVFEFMPKAMGVVTEQYGPEALPIIVRAIGKHFQMTGGKFWQQIPEYEALGVYGVRHKPAQTKIGKVLEKADIVQFTENPLRSISYTLGEELRNAGYDASGAKLLEKVAFVNRFGNEPMIFMNQDSKTTLTLMRYSINATKFYLGMVSKAAKGDKNSIAALCLFSAMQAMQTGSQSAVPLPVDLVLNKATDGEWHNALKEFDQVVPVNLAGKLFNTDFSETTQPVGGVSLGAGGAIATGNLKAIGSATGKAAKALGEGDVAGGSLRMLEAVLAGMQLGKFKNELVLPGSARKLVGAMADAIDDDDDIQNTLRQEFNFKSPD